MNLYSLIPFVAALVLLCLGILHIVKGAQKPQKSYFLIAAFFLAASQIALGLMLLATGLERVIRCMRVLLACAVFLPAVGIPFYLFFGKKNERELLTKYLPTIVIGTFALAAAALLAQPSFVIKEIHFTEDGLFWGLTFSMPGKVIGAFLLLANVFILYLFENTYRSATVAGKVTLKYPLLGIVTASILHFVVISRVLSISVLERNYFAIHSCGLIALSLSFLYATFRYRLFDVQVYIGRGIASSVVTVIIAGLYLTALALISYIAKRLGLPFDLFTWTVFGIFAVFLLVAVLISGKAKRRLRQFINENFYLNRYDYRKEWRHYAQLMASSATVDDFLTNTIGSLCETMLIQKGLIWTDIKGGRSASYGMPEDVASRLPAKRLRNLEAGESVIIIDSRKRALLESSGTDNGQPEGESWAWLRAVAFLVHNDAFTGCIALGEKDMETPYTGEDREFLATIADQATLTLENLLMGERILESNQMTSFNRFASFVVHDLKNTVGMLSLTAENARENIADTNFQQDAIETINRSVAKMKRLIDSLNAHKSPDSLTRVTTDMRELCEKAVSSFKRMATSKGVSCEIAADERIEGIVDPAAIRRVIENLVLNAIEATDEGDTVTVSVKQAPPNRIMISVKDTGSGFDPYYLRDNLFKQFQSTKRGGLGIGLVLCKSLVEAHDGKISIESVPGEGAEVMVDLPAELEPGKGGGNGA
ncbi:MAG: PEP-CTERM system histidine kinase PrsK [bacterium]|nr:MAG: PEP-CTERM system histidine kinase PrsK [bacterium]